MDLSIFLARFFGLYFLIVGGFYALRKDSFRPIIKDFYASPALRVFAAIFNVFFGLLIILLHNVWELNWSILITLIGYLSLAKGVVNLYFPEQGKEWSEKFLEGNVPLYTSAVTLVIGLLLLFVGFF